MNIPKKSYLKTHSLFGHNNPLYQQLSAKEKQKISKIWHSRINWHFAIPKSGSTYLFRFFEKAKTLNIIQAVPYYGDRPQHLCLHTVNDQIVKNRNYKPLVNARAHTLPTLDTLLFINPELHKLIIQKRNFWPVAKSYLKQLDRSNADFLTLVGNENKATSLYKLYQFHVNFCNGWDYVSNFLPTFFIEFDEAITLQHNGVQSKLETFIGVELSDGIVDLNNTNKTPKNP